MFSIATKKKILFFLIIEFILNYFLFNAITVAAEAIVAFYPVLILKSALIFPYKKNTLRIFISI